MDARGNLLCIPSRVINHDLQNVGLISRLVAFSSVPISEGLKEGLVAF